MCRPWRLTTLIAGSLLAASVWAGEEIKVVEHAVSDTVTDIGAKGDSVGDLLTWSNPVFDAADKSQVGSDQGFCIRVVVGKSWECFWTLVLKEGQITVEGPFADAGDSTLAITGGTGRYTGAKGALKLHARDAKATAYDFDYRLQ
jgi:hypothetical protein